MVTPASRQSPAQETFRRGEHSTAVRIDAAVENQRKCPGEVSGTYGMGARVGGGVSLTPGGREMSTVATHLAFQQHLQDWGFRGSLPYKLDNSAGGRVGSPSAQGPWKSVEEEPQILREWGMRQTIYAIL